MTVSFDVRMTSRELNIRKKITVYLAFRLILKGSMNQRQQDQWKWSLEKNMCNTDCTK